MKPFPSAALLSVTAQLFACSGSNSSTSGSPAPTVSSDGGTGRPYTHVASCMTALASGSPQNAHRFAVAVIYDQGLAKATFELTPLTVGTAKLEAAQVVGEVITLADFAVARINGAFSYESPMGAKLEIPGDANPISGSRIILEKLDMSGKINLTTPSFCGRFVAKIIEPVTLKGNDISAVCVFEKKAVGDATPVLKTSDFDACTTK